MSSPIHSVSPRKCLCAHGPNDRLLGVSRHTGNESHKAFREVSVQGAVCRGKGPLFPRRGASGPCRESVEACDDSQGPGLADLWEEMEEMEGESAVGSWAEATECCL